MGCVGKYVELAPIDAKASMKGLLLNVVYTQDQEIAS